MPRPARDDLTVARKHELVQCERVGDTLVVTPLGDRMEYSNGVFEHELNRVRRIASNETVRNIVCDFSEKGYFSQELVVPILGLRDHVRTRGRFVAAGMSEQMSKMFEHSESGTHILQYPDRNSAISQVADVSISEAASARFRQNRRLLMPISIVAVIAMLAAGWFAIGEPYFFGSPAAQLYRTLASCWADADEVVNSQPTKANWNGLKSRFLENLTGPVASLRDKTEKTPADVAVLAAANKLQSIAGEPRDRIEIMQDQFLPLAEKARTVIEQADGVSLPKIEEIDIPYVD